MIPFNKPYLTGQELPNIAEAHSRGQLAGDGYFTQRCKQWLEEMTGCPQVLITHSCTAAIEMAAILIDTRPGDEIIMPSYTFVSTANPFVLRGGTPVFVDIREDTLNIDEHCIERMISPRTKAIVVVHYAGISCNMSAIMKIARSHNLIVIEDAAQALVSTYQGDALGTIGDLGCISFHETKNIQCGEGGALYVNNSRFSERAEIIREKGTNRTNFSRGLVDKYTWVDVGSSFLPGELSTAFLYAQLVNSSAITSERIKIWEKYYSFFAGISADHSITLPSVQDGCMHNAHIFYLLLPGEMQRNLFIKRMKERLVQCVFHYVPLHNAPMAASSRWVSPKLPVTESVSSRLVRLPLWVELNHHLDYILVSASEVLGTLYS